jgi:hypothetical protein
MSRGVVATCTTGWFLLATAGAAAEWLVAPLPPTDLLGRTMSPAAATAAWPVELRLPASSAGEELALWLPDGRRHSAIVDRVERSGARTTFWGRVDAWRLDHGHVVGTAIGARRAATITLDGRIYRLLPAPGDEPRGELFTVAAPRHECGGTLADHTMPAIGNATALPARPPGAATVRPPPAADPVIDVLVLYTSEARQRAGGAASVELEIQHAIDHTNAVFANSAVAARVALAGAREIDYQQSRTSSLEDLTFLATSPEAAALREQVRADLVGLVKATCQPGGCGRATGMSSDMRGTAIAPVPVFVASLDAPLPLNFTHELGHDLGCQHEPEHAAPAAEAAFLGIARAGQDFVATSGRLSWATGEGDVVALAIAGLYGSNRRIVIPLLDDDRRERDETFTVQLRRPKGGAKLGAAQVRVTLVDDDP